METAWIIDASQFSRVADRIEPPWHFPFRCCCCYCCCSCLKKKMFPLFADWFLHVVGLASRDHRRGERGNISGNDQFSPATATTAEPSPASNHQLLPPSPSSSPSQNNQNDMTITVITISKTHSFPNQLPRCRSRRYANWRDVSGVRCQVTAIGPQLPGEGRGLDGSSPPVLPSARLRG